MTQQYYGNKCIDKKPANPVSSKIVSGAMRELAATIQCDDGVANAACYQAADMIDDQAAKIDRLLIALSDNK